MSRFSGCCRLWYRRKRCFSPLVAFSLVRLEMNISFGLRRLTFRFTRGTKGSFVEEARDFKRPDRNGSSFGIIVILGSIGAAVDKVRQTGLHKARVSVSRLGQEQGALSCAWFLGYQTWPPEKLFEFINHRDALSLHIIPP